MASNEIGVNTTTASSQLDSEVASLGDDKYIVTWTGYSGTDASGAGVYAQILVVMAQNLEMNFL